MGDLRDQAKGGLGRWLHRGLVYPGVVRIRGEGAVFARLRELRAIERLPTEDLLRRQRAQLASMLNYARERSPYYGARWSDRSQVLADAAHERLAELPFLTKRDLQEFREELLARPGPKRVTRKTTGGSTGEPVTVVKDRRATAYEMAASWLGYGWHGVQIGDRAARFWGSPYTLKRRLRFAAADFAMHRIRFSAFAFDEGDLEHYWRACKRFRPDYFYGYVSMLEAFAAFVKSSGYDGAALRLKSVVTTSEVLAPSQRSLIQSTFGTRVQDEYGCGEVGAIAYECEEGRLHVMSENVVVEILTPTGEPAQPGEPGEIVVTDLGNRAMPLVRYRLGDFAVPGLPCRCGRGFPVLERIWGRAYDFVEAPGGRRYHGEYFMYLIEELRAAGRPIGQFQIVQESAGSLAIAIVMPESARSEVQADILSRLGRTLPGMEITVSRVAGISRESSGKMRVIRNRWLEGGDDNDDRS
ncbi:MAG: phenylacetate--CoA ligase family protein [Gemmatimonadota bacterium]|nr:MAG: phenylacetate--CoA ligase family protein [Gemmatimonadota bacterium]